MKRMPLIASFVLFIALCVSVAFWAMQLFNPPLRAVAAPPQAGQSAPSLDAAASLLGGRSNTAVASNFQLKGVVVASDPAESVAILSANGKAALAIRTNRDVQPGVTLVEVHRDHVLLSEGGMIKRVDLPIDTKQRAGAITSSPVNSSRRTPANKPGQRNAAR